MMGKSEVTCDNYRRAMNRDIPLYDVDDRCCFLCGWNEATIGSNDNVNEWDDEQVSLLEQCTRNQSGALERCSDCDLVWYCSQDHLQIHRINGRCFPFVIKKTKDKGRYGKLGCCIKMIIFDLCTADVASNTEQSKLVLCRDP